MRREAGGAQPLDEERQAVSSPMMTDLVLQSPKDRERRNCQQQITSRPQHAADFVQRREIVLDMFDDVRRQDEIELAIGERQRTDVGRLNRSEALFGAKPDRLGVEVDARHPREAEIAQQAQIGAGAGTDVENCSVGRQREPFDQGREQAATSDEPPMIGLDRRFGGIGRDFLRPRFGLPPISQSSQRA